MTRPTLAEPVPGVTTSDPIHRRPHPGMTTSDPIHPRPHPGMTTSDPIHPRPHPGMITVLVRGAARSGRIRTEPAIIGRAAAGWAAGAGQVARAAAGAAR